MATGISITHREIGSEKVIDAISRRICKGWFPFILKKKVVKIMLEETNVSKR